MRMIWMVLLFVGCGSTAPTSAPAPAPAPAAQAPAAESDAEALARVEGAAKELGSTLKKRVVAAMGEGGPEHAVDVCNTEAQLLTTGVAERTEVDVGRASLRVRNPKNDGPAWVQAWLKEQGERKAEGVAPMREVVETDNGKVARVIFPIAMEAPCVACHGSEEQIPAPVQTLIAERYPTDAAIGYSEGDLRGALWAEATVR